MKTGSQVAAKFFGRGTQFYDDAGHAFEVTAKPFKGKFSARSLETGEVRSFSAFDKFNVMTAGQTEGSAVFRSLFGAPQP